MQILFSKGPISETQKRFNRVVGFVLPAIGILVGFWEAVECSRIRFGYVAVYAYATAIVLGGIVTVIGLLPLIYWRTRRLGVALIGCGVLSVAAFYGVSHC